MNRHSYPGPRRGEALYIEGRDSGDCHIHKWAEEELRTRLLTQLRESHAKGGTNVCRACVQRLTAMRDRLEREGVGRVTHTPPPGDDEDWKRLAWSYAGTERYRRDRPDRYPGEPPPNTVAVAWWYRDGEWVIDQCDVSEEALMEKLARTRHLFSPREHTVRVYGDSRDPGSSE